MVVVVAASWVPEAGREGEGQEWRQTGVRCGAVEGCGCSLTCRWLLLLLLLVDQYIILAQFRGNRRRVKTPRGEGRKGYVVAAVVTADKSFAGKSMTVFISLPRRSKPSTSQRP